MKRLYIEQEFFKIEDHYPIVDENGETIYFVDEDFKFFEKHLEITNVKTNEIISIDKQFPTLLPKFDITFPNGKVLTLKSEFSIFSKYITVLPEKEYITIEGNFFDYEFRVMKGGELIGFVEKELFRLRDCFTINVINEEYEELFIAIMIAIDNIQDSQAN